MDITDCTSTLQVVECLRAAAQHDISESEAEAVAKWNRRTPLRSTNKGGTECRMS